MLISSCSKRNNSSSRRAGIEERRRARRAAARAARPPGRGIHALALAAGKLGGHAVAEAVELDELEQRVDALPDLGVRGAVAAAHAQPESDVLEDAHVAEEGVVLEDEAHLARLRRLPGGLDTAYADRAGIGPRQPGQQAQQRGLAAAGGAEQREQLAVVDIEADVLERLEVAKGVGEVADLNVHGVTGWP